MQVGTYVRFSRPGSMRSQTEWSGMIIQCSNMNYLIRDQSGKIRVVPTTEKWLKEEKNGFKQDQRKTEAKNT